jgi:hypothetical protein
MARELSKDTIMVWRQFTTKEAFHDGINYLRRECAPKRVGNDVPAMIEHAAKWSAYQEALDDLVDVLTNIPKAEKSIDEPNLNA